ncbi:AP-1 complex subunit mu-2 Adaptor [Vigna angularis]|uniref:AP-1 complex subunit mu-2 Adaptor n=1 Tax=Phaseolus angularis TaxID=3914 RepID=A0A8T0JDY6_PHAAN|nr:AP-1 complex subunit mu-2 Adaptor [Vigna angularis]
MHMKFQRVRNPGSDHYSNKQWQGQPRLCSYSTSKVASSPGLTTDAKRFFTKLIEKQADPQSQDLVVVDNGVTYMFVQHSNVYIMIATRQNCNAASLLCLSITSKNWKRNRLGITLSRWQYELLDEIMDFRYP